MDIKASKREVLEKLVEGYEFASQLQHLLSKPIEDHDLHGSTRIVPGSDSVSGSDSMEQLMTKILGSFDKVISVLGSQNTSCADRCMDSNDSRKNLGGNKGKRGCYKRKRKWQSWTVETDTLKDPYAWRKYGQKEILNSKYPRSYFRCTHKYSHGCEAIKQVQKLDSRKFHITYIGSHTCDPTRLEQSEIIINSSNNVITFSTADAEQSNPKLEETRSTAVTGDSVKTEHMNSSSLDHDYNYQHGSWVWPDIMASDIDEEHGFLHSYGDTSSSHYMLMDWMSFGTHGDIYSV